MAVVAVCPEHGAFESRQFGGAEGTSISYRGSSEPCPTCGVQSAVMEGTYNFDQHGIAEALSAPMWSRFALRQVQAEVQSLANAAENPLISDSELDRLAEKVAERVSARDQGLADIIVQQIKGKPRSAIVAFLVGLVTVLGMMDGAVAGSRLTYDFVERIVHEVLGR
jgi:hypothetical protein